MMLNVDLSILNSLQWMKNPIMDRIMVFITTLGDNAFIWILIAMIFMLKKKYRRFGIFILLGLGIGFLIGNVFMKNIVARSRPCWNNNTIVLLIQNPMDYSFPSGHTLHSFIAATMIVLWDKRWMIPAFILAGAIAFSRLYLYVHYPTDILGGAVLGILIGIFMIWLYQGRGELFYEKWLTAKVKSSD